MAGRPASRELGAEARIEAEDAHGTYWWPLGIGAALGALGAAAALRGRRILGTLLGAVGAAAIADDFPPGERRLRRFLPERTTYNVVCELGDPDAERTDRRSAPTTTPPTPGSSSTRPARARRPPRDARPHRHQPAADGAGRRRPGAGGARRRDRPPRRSPSSASSSASAAVAAMADIGARKSVPAANDNGTAVVALLELARRFRADPPEGVRVILLSDRLGGVLQRGDQSLRRAPLRRAADARAPSSSAWRRSAPPTCWRCRARGS